MRVIGGKFKGKALAAPNGFLVRPTTGRIRETIFNILASKNALDGARVLDLFCGSGALGIEALSRGARDAVFIDKSNESARLAVKNLTACGIACGKKGELAGLGDSKTGENDEVVNGKNALGQIVELNEKTVPTAWVYNTDFQVALKKLKGEKFDLIFLDPPYFDKLEEKCLNLLQKYDVLTDCGVIVFEHSSKNSLSDRQHGFIIDTRKFGSVSVSFLSKE